MWTYDNVRRPFYRRTGFLSVVGVFAALVVGGGVWGFREKGRWEEKARALDYRKLRDMESASVIYDRSGEVLSRLFVQNRDQVSVEELSPALLTAVEAAEDARFFEHNGVDYRGVARAVVRNWQRKRMAQGASTITQQLARNTFPKELPATDKSVSRKVFEMFVAMEIERRCDKRTILELYLNRIFFGSGFYGAESASRGYFGKRAKDLTLSEAAMLAGLLKSPSNLSPWRNRQACLERRDYVLQRALELKLIARGDYDAALAQEILVKNRKPIHQESYAADVVSQQLEKLVGRERAAKEGFRIFTAIDGALQKKAEQALRDQLSVVEHREGYDHPTFEKYDALYRARVRGADGELPALPAPEYLQGAVTVLDNRNGAVLALVGGRDFGHSEYNRAITARVPPGTAFKPLVYAAGFESGLFPGTTVQDEQMDNRQVMIGGATGILGEWGPERADNRFEGLMTSREALVKSKNSATVRFGNMVKIDRVLALARQAGIETKLSAFPRTFLGSSEVTLMELTLANTMFPNGGTRPLKAFIIERVEDQDGVVIFQSQPQTKRVIKPTTAYEVHSCLAEVLERGPAEKTYTELGVKKCDLGGKSGTAYNFTHAWFMGYSSAITCGVWVGFDKPRTTIYRGAFGSEVALPIWAEVMKASFDGHRPEAIARPEGLLKYEVCTHSGLLGTDKCFETIENKETGQKVQHRTTVFEMATEEQAPKDACDVHGDTPRSFVKVIPGQEFPRAVAVVDVKKRESVAIKAPTVLGDDPYKSVQVSGNAVNAQKSDGQASPADGSSKGESPNANASGDPPVMRAEAVRPVDAIGGQESPIKLDPPKPIRF